MSHSLDEVFDPENPKKVFEGLWKRMQAADEYYIRCIVDEAWMLKGPAPFDFVIKDGIFTARVIASSRREAMLKVVDALPVTKFLDEDDGE